VGSIRFAFLVVAVALVACMPARTRGETVGWGDFELFLDGAAFRAADGGSVEELYIRVRNSGLKFKKSKGSFESRVNLSLVVADSTGKVVVSEIKEVKFYEADELSAASAVRFHTVVRKLALRPGTYRASCVFEDLNAPKVSMVGLLKGKNKSATVTDYPILVPAFPKDVLSVSDAEFLWNAEATKSGRNYQPNPPRLYGLYLDSLRVYVEAYVPESIASSETLRFEMEVLDQSGAVKKSAAIPLPKLSARGVDGLVTYPILIQEDLNNLIAGSYTLYLSAGLTDQLMVRMRAGRFNVAWDLRTWEVTRRDYLVEARFLLSDGDFAKFEELGMGEQEKSLADLWKKIDPDPSTGVNEAYQKFLQRVEYVRAKYTDYQSGIFSDRGLVYLKYGAPDEMEVDVVPQNRESLSDAMQKVEDKFHPINYSNTGARLRFARPGDNIFVDPRHLGMVGEQGDVGFPYELWTYNSGGDPILERDRALETDIGMRFMFVDTEGYGRYKLESSSSMMSK
jgi:GWxTD domain-containing protein